MDKEKTTRIMKRNGSIVDFDSNKITEAVRKAFIAVKENEVKVESLAMEVVGTLEKRFAGKIPGVEDIQDIVEETLMRWGYPEVAKAYILYRQKRAEIRRVKSFIGVKDELKLSVSAVNVLEKRYLLKSEKGGLIETPAQMFRRVAKTVASVDNRYNLKRNADDVEKEFYNLMVNHDFLPNAPTLMYAGTEISQLSACYVIPIEDSMESIFDALKYMALIHKSGGGTGLSFSNLRPKGDIVKSTKGVASGPVSFMRVFDIATEVIRQGGKRKGNNMGVLRSDHPDIIEFITAKTKENFLTNFNLSVSIPNHFMEKLHEDGENELINPRTASPVRKLKTTDLLDLIATIAWRTGNPSLLFIDKIIENNPTPHIGEIDSTSPCGEQPLLPYESCPLGSINLSNMVVEGKIDFDKLKKIIHGAVHFLDNAIDANRYPLPQIEKVTKGNRKIGLGVMGFADALIKMGIPYNSKEAIQTAERFMRYICKESRLMSIELAEKRGSFPNFKGSIWEDDYESMRNATTTTIAPTGTLSLIADCSCGIEPLFVISFVRNLMGGTRLLEVNPLFEVTAWREGFHRDELMAAIARHGSIKDFTEIPSKIRKLFVTALDIELEWHIKMQAAFQKYTDNAVAKVINLSPDATVEDIRKSFILAYKMGCKGVTVYRYGSNKNQLLNIGSISARERGEQEYVRVDAEYSGGHLITQCPEE